MNRAEFDLFLMLVTLDDELHDLSKTQSLYEQDIALLQKQEDESLSLIKHLHDSVSTLKKQAHAKELEIKTLDATLPLKEQHLINAHQVKEYLSLQNEIKVLEQKRIEADEQLLFLWNEIEVADKAYQATQAEQKDLVERLEKELRIKRKRIADIEQEKEKLTQDRVPLTKQVPEDLYKKYESIRQKVKNAAVIVQNDSCSACFYPLSAQDVSATRDSQLRDCSDCYRILYQRP